MERVFIVKADQTLELRPPPQSLDKLKEACRQTFGFPLQVKLQTVGTVIENTQHLLAEYAKCSDSLTLEVTEDTAQDYRLLTNSLSLSEAYDAPTAFFQRLGKFLVFFANSTNADAAAYQFALPTILVKALQTAYSSQDSAEPYPIRKSSDLPDIVNISSTLSAFISGRQTASAVCARLELPQECLGKWVSLVRQPVPELDTVKISGFPAWFRTSLLADYLLGMYTADELHDLYEVSKTELAIWAHYEMNPSILAPVLVGHSAECTRRQPDERNHTVLDQPLCATAAVKLFYYH